MMLIKEYGFEGLLYIIIGLVIMALINGAISLIPAAIAKVFSKDEDLAKGVFVISFIILFVLEFLVF